MRYLLSIFLVCTQTLFAQESGNRDYHSRQVPADNTASAVMPENEIVLAVSGLMNVRTEVYVAHFHVVQVGTTPASVDGLINGRIRKFKTGLTKLGIDTSQFVTTDMISFVPKYDFNFLHRRFTANFNEQPDAFEVQKNVMVRFDDRRYMDHIITAAAAAEVYDLVKVDHFLNDIKKHYSQLRKECLSALQEKITDYESAGVRLDTLRKTIADDFGTVLPGIRYASYTPVARPSFSALKVAGDGNSKMSNARVASSRYYEALAYDDFDVVINPVVDQPVVQLTYQLKVKYLLSPPRGGTKEYHLIAPNGAIQKLDLR